MWNKSKNKKPRKTMAEKLSDKMSETLADPINDLTKSKEISDMLQIMESYHAHFEKMLEVQAKILNILEVTNKMKGAFNEEYYYKEKGFEKANQNKIQGNTITVK